MAQRACARNVAGLQDVGDMAYDLVRPILKQIDNPEQLRNVEIASPHIADHSAELWKALIARDIPQWKEKIMEPKNPRSWWKVYRKLVREEQRLKEAQEEQLRAAMSDISKKKETNQVQFRPDMPLQAHRDDATSFFVFGNPNPNINTNGQVKKPNLRNATTGRQVLTALRKQSAAAARQKGLARTQPHIQPASVTLPSAKSQIKRAPESMLRDHAKPAPTATARPQPQTAGQQRRLSATNAFVTPRASTPQQKALNETSRAEQKKREDRLRALTGGAAKAPSATSPPPPPPAPQSSTTNSQPSLATSPPFLAPRAATTTSQPSRAMSPTSKATSPQSKATPPPPKSTPKPPITRQRAAPIIQRSKEVTAGHPEPTNSKPATSAVANLSVAAAEPRKRLSPSPGPLATPPPKKRAAQPVSIFMPSKKRKV